MSNESCTLLARILTLLHNHKPRTAAYFAEKLCASYDTVYATLMEAISRGILQRKQVRFGERLINLFSLPAC